MSPAAADLASDPAAQAMVALASTQLAGRLDLSLDEITLVRVQAVEWRDASLGCPKPGVDYVQRLTPGYAITLEAGGQVHEFHTDDAHRVIRCSAGKN